ncbi:MAG: ribulose-phosphate 3-epimerase [Defluviitaleaceae bacterium]|nr:ribulose-phosphate 3-epimerase [Defluviitaleaceae bacterium]MCL2264237.1 ribulose-phosphate 3-epimerase [Defluviitaleaceae bacterium]
MSISVPKIHPSILCADHGDLRRDIIRLTEAGADYMHMDVMDGDFVPNFGLGTEIFNCVRKYSNVPLDVHLMVREPLWHIKLFRELGAEIITVHPEASPQIVETLALIREVGAKTGIALNPETPVDTVEKLLPMCDHVLAMTVNPGFYGQDFLEFTIPKLQRLGELSKQYGFSLCVDGNINAERVKQLHPLGVTNFVIGSALFRENPADMIKQIKSEV